MRERTFHALTYKVECSCYALCVLLTNKTKANERMKMLQRDRVQAKILNPPPTYLN